MPSDNSPLRPAPLIARSPLAWLAVFGPGAVLASLTIGVGELVFSSRAGALFGYRLLWLFGLTLVLKWILVFGSARHMVLTGAHPFQRWLDLPGPRGWFPLAFFLIAIPCFPIWVCFHAGTLGTLIASVTGTAGAWRGGAHLLWGAGVLLLTLQISVRGGYRALERIQLIITFLMLGSVIVALFFLRPDWAAFFQGLVIPQTPPYPDWVRSNPEFATRSVWLEVTTCVGILGGSAYDYLAYTSYLRDKHWGLAGQRIASSTDLARLDAPTRHDLRRWLWAPLVDCTLSFLAVLIFTAVFVIGGAEVLGPNHQVPAGSNLLSLQAEFLAVLHPWFRPVYFAGAFLAVLGTLYGTIEVAPAILREMIRALHPELAGPAEGRLRWWALAWAGAGGLLLVGCTIAYHALSGSDRPPALVAILTPANLFTGVLGCGLICWANCWTDRRFLPRDLRPAGVSVVASLVAGVAFVVLGLIAYWDHSGWLAYAILAGTVLLGVIGAHGFRRFIRS